MALAASDAKPLPWKATPISHATSAADPSDTTVAWTTPMGSGSSLRRTIQFSHASSPEADVPERRGDARQRQSVCRDPHLGSLDGLLIVVVVRRVSRIRSGAMRNRRQSSTTVTSS